MGVPRLGRVTSIERVDIGDDLAFAAFHDVYLRSHERDFDQPYSAVEKRVGLRSDAYADKVALLARDDEGMPVGGGSIELTLRDNADVAFFDAFTVPEHRRRGHATAVVEEVEGIAQDAGRSHLFTEAIWAVDEVDPAQQVVAERLGFRLDLMDAVRALTLPATLPPLQVADGYAIHSWRGVCPDEWVEGYVDVRRLLVQEAPSGDLALENEFWDIARVRTEEAQWALQRRTPQVSIAVSDDGNVVGHTQLLFPADDDEVFQWDTLVLPTHRGHGLGLALKVATMQQAADLLEGRRRITTYNAAGNEPMIRVNEALGFRMIAWCAEYVKEL
jgi:RimJ/RimL family protein N-acetyltransferase